MGSTARGKYGQVSLKQGSLTQNWTLHSREWQRKAGKGSPNQDRAQGKAEQGKVEQKGSA